MHTKSLVPAWTPVLLLAATGCLNGPTLVSVTPDNDYVDGCRPIVIQGHHLGTSASASLGGTDLALAPAEEDTDYPDYAQDVGFVYYATPPPASSGAAGFVDVTMTVDGEEMVLSDYFYYRSCPGPLTLDVAVFEGAANAVLPLEGCGIDAAATSGRLLDMLDGSEVATFGLDQVCSTAQATWTVPDVAADSSWSPRRSGPTTGPCTAATPCPRASVTPPVSSSWPRARPRARTATASASGWTTSVSRTSAPRTTRVAPAGSSRVWRAPVATA